MSEIERRVEVPGLFGSRGSAYAQVVLAGELIFVAGQGGNDQNGKLASLEFEPQVRQAFANIAIALESVGATLADLVATTTFITDWRYGREFTQLRAQILGDNLPTSALIGVEQLAYPEMLIEIQSIAVRHGG